MTPAGRENNQAPIRVLPEPAPQEKVYMDLTNALHWPKLNRSYKSVNAGVFSGT
jgi:hypothetical protein